MCKFCIDIIFLFLLEIYIYIGVEFLGHMVTVYQNFWGSDKLFSKACAPFYNPTSHTRGSKGLSLTHCMFQQRKATCFLKFSFHISLSWTILHFLKQRHKISPLYGDIKWDDTPIISHFIFSSQGEMIEAIKYLKKVVKIAGNNFQRLDVVKASTMLGDIYNEKVSICVSFL